MNLSNSRTVTTFNQNIVKFNLKDNLLIVSNNGNPFPIEGVESLMTPNYTSKIERSYKVEYQAFSINDQVEELFERRKDEYLHRPERIQSDYNKEHEAVGEYHGREVLELLQNCIDAMPGDNTIQIGAKGIGFRSLLNWCDRIKIYSGELSIAFGLDEAAAFKKLLGSNQKVAILSAPTIIDTIDLDFTTRIELSLKPTMVEDVRQQLNQIDEKSMVFLPKIESLIVQDGQEERQYEKHEDPNGNVYVISSVDGEKSECCWRVFKQEIKTISIEDTNNESQEYKYGISVAYSADLDKIEENCLYSYFKTKVELPIGWLCHADFKLSSDRNSIIDHRLNEIILKDMIMLIEESSELITDGNKAAGVLTSVTPTTDFSRQLNIRFDFSDYYYEHIGSKKILPTADGKFISVNDGPLLFGSDYPSLFTGSAFNKLLKLPDNKKVSHFVVQLAKRKDIDLNVSQEVLMHLINNVSENWSANDCFTVFEWWRKNHSSKTLVHMPNLIKLENGKWAKLSDNIYLKTGNVPNVPKWVDFNFLSKEYQDAAIKYYGEEEGHIKFKELRESSTNTQIQSERSISDYVKINEKQFFNYLDRNGIIRQVNASVKDHWGHAREFLCWLFKNYSADETWNPPLLKYCFPAYDRKTVCGPEELYFGKYYNNNLAEILFLQPGLKEIHHIKLSKKDNERFVEFFSKFKVRLLPLYQQEKIEYFELSQDYRRALIDKFTYPIQLEGAIVANATVMRNEYNIHTASVRTYQSLQNILDVADTQSILFWISKDDFLKESLKSTYEKSDTSHIVTSKMSHRYGRKISNGNIRNYIAHVFSMEKWVQVDGIRYSPNRIILDDRIGLKFKPQLVGKSKEALFGEFKIEEHEQNAIIHNLGFNSDFSKIDPQTLYDILIELSEEGMDDDGEISKKIYSQIIKASGLKEPNINDVKRKEFLEKGSVFCYDGKFHSINEVKYADKSFPNKFKEQHNLFHLSKGGGARKVERWFGVEELEQNTLVKEFRESIYNQQFQEFFCELLKGLYVENCQQITDEKRWRAVKNMHIRLASSGTLEINGNDLIPLSGHQYALDDDGKYVLMVGESEPDPHNECFSNALFEIVKIVINAEESSLEGSFRELMKSRQGMLRTILIERHENPDIWSDADIFFDGVSNESSRNIVFKNIELFNDCKEKNLERFKRILYNKLSKNPDVNQQRSFLEQIGRYRKIMIDSDTSELQEENCNVLELLQSIDPASMLRNEDCDIDVEYLGKETKQKLLNDFKDNKVELNLFLVNEFDSLLRFGNYDYLKAEFKRYLESTKQKPTNMPTYSSISKMPSVTDSSTHRLGPQSLRNETKSNRQCVRTGYTDYEAKHNRSITRGSESEQIVVDYLKKVSEVYEVKWVSQFAKDANENLDGSDGAGYDLSYCKNGNKFYVEVKTNSDILPSISFRLTRFEREFATLNPNYQIFVVTNPESETPDIRFFSWKQIEQYANNPTEYTVDFIDEETLK